MLSFRTTETFRWLLLWVLTCAVAFAIQLNWMSATFTTEGFVPVGNDAFYHARRMIDAAADLGSFYQFDPRIHAPEGSLLVWPWGYDFGMALLLKAGQGLGLADDPMKFLAYIPSFAVILSVTLVLVIARALSFGIAMAAVLALCVALSPLTQGLHGIGSVDHHFAEYILILSAVAAFLWWMRRPDSLRHAAFVGLVLGFAPAVHNGLFALQLPVLGALAILWIRGIPPSPAAATSFGLALLIATVLVLLPSLPFRLGLFDFYLLSWFHLYVAACTGAIAWLFSKLGFNARSLLLVLLFSVATAVPLLGQLLLAGDFVGKEADALSNILEAQSVLQLHANRGWEGVIRLYSGLVYLAPLTWIGCALALMRTRHRPTIFVCVYALMTLPLLLMQFRFHYYGSLGLYLPLLLWVHSSATERWRTPLVVASLALIAVFYYPAVRHGLTGGRQLGNDVYYQMTRKALVPLAEACKKDPGIVLARNNDGHYIRYHTECSVIANNFLLTEQQFDAARRVDALFHMTPAQLVASSFPVKYVLVRARGIVLVRQDGTLTIVPQEEANVVTDPLSDGLLWGDLDRVPKEFTLLAEIPVPGEQYPYARLWKLERSPRSE
jgi:hypothetical protein